MAGRGYMRGNWWLLLSVLSTTLTGLIVGYDLCIVSTLLDNISSDLRLCGIVNPPSLSSTHADLYSEKKEEFACLKQTLIVSILSPGAAIGSITAGVFADIYGRRATLMLADCCFILGSLFFWFGVSYNSVIIGRLWLGAGVGVGFVVFSTYIAEIAPENHRGKLVAIQDGALSLGCFFSFLIISLVSTTYWRELIGCLSLIAFFQFVGAIFLPESPRWLVKKGRKYDALETLLLLTPLSASVSSSATSDLNEEKDVRLKNCMDLVEMIEKDVIRNRQLKQRVKDDLKHKLTAPVDVELQHHDPNICSLENAPIPVQGNSISSVQAANHTMDSMVSTETVRIKSKTEGNDEETRSHGHLRWKERPVSAKVLYEAAMHKIREYKELCWMYRRSIGVAVGCACAQNFMFGNNLIYYTVPILKRKAIVQDTRIFALGIGFSKFFGIISAILFVDKVGRRPLLLWGSIATCVGHVVFSILFYLLEMYGSIRPVVVGILVNLYIFIFSWNISWAGLMFVVASEELPSAVRGIGISLTITTFWVLSFLFQLTFGLIIEFLTFPGAFGLFALMNLVSILFVIFCIRDHTRVRLEDIQNDAFIIKGGK